jgi:hypothetical protein
MLSLTPGAKLQTLLSWKPFENLSIKTIILQMLLSSEAV